MIDIEFQKKVLKFIEKINEEYEIKFAYLFGSRARGEEKDNSDIDIGIYFEKSYSEMEETFIRGNIIEQGMAFFDLSVDIVSLRKANLSLSYEIIKDGIVLKDSDDRGDFESIVLREYFDFKYYADIYNQAIVDSIKNDTYF